MSAFPEGPVLDGGQEPEHPRLHQRPLSVAERRARWEVRAAQWRALELAQTVFGDVRDGALLGLRTDGPLRGLLRLEVPFGCMASHEERESRFLAAVAADPVLTRVQLVFVIAPDRV